VLVLDELEVATVFGVAAFPRISLIALQVDEVATVSHVRRALMSVKPCLILHLEPGTG
jgi:hypothetical protein